MNGWKFGDPVENISASQDNPVKRGFFVRLESWFGEPQAEYTNGKGEFWKTSPDNLRATSPSVVPAGTDEVRRLRKALSLARSDILSVVGQIERDLAAPAPSPAANDTLAEMLEVGAAEAFEEADFAILYREIEDSGTTTNQEIFNIPQDWCREIARLLRSLAVTATEAQPAKDADILELEQEIERMRAAVTPQCSEDASNG